MKKIITISILAFLTVNISAHNIDLRGEWIVQNAIKSFPIENYDTTFFKIGNLSLVKNQGYYDTTMSILTLSETGTFNYCVNTEIGKIDTLETKINVDIIEGTCMNQYGLKNWHFDCATMFLDLFFDNPQNDGIGISDEEFDKLNIQRKKISFKVNQIGINQIELVLKKNLTKPKLH